MPAVRIIPRARLASVRTLYAVRTPAGTAWHAVTAPGKRGRAVPRASDDQAREFRSLDAVEALLRTKLALPAGRPLQLIVTVEPNASAPTAVRKAQRGLRNKRERNYE